MNVFSILTSNILKTIVGLFCLCCTQLTSGQHFKYKAALSPVHSSSFYRLNIPPSVSGKIQVDFSDVRIFNQKGKETPFVLKSSNGAFVERDFEELPIVSKHKGGDNQTHIIIENPGKKRLADLVVFIKNTNVQRTVILSGGEDTSTWYVIKENFLLENFSNNNNYESFIQTISFPPVTYQYLKITIVGKDILPVDITRVGIITEKFGKGTYHHLPAPEIKIIDSSDKQSYVFLHFKETFHIDKLDLTFTGPKYYKRNIAFYFDNKGTETPVEFTLASNIPATFTLDRKASDILLVIRNEDNPPLQLLEVRAMELDKYLLTFLEKGELYRLYFGDNKAIAPSYDLRFFVDSIPAVLPTIGLGKIETNNTAAVIGKDEKFSQSVFLGVIIACVLCLLLFTCYKLIKGVEKEKNDTV